MRKQIPWSRGWHVVVAEGEKPYVEDPWGVKKYGSEQDGYMKLSIDEVRTSMHKVIAQCCVENPNPHLFNEVDHTNRVRWENQPSNLRWCTRWLNNMNKKKSAVREVKKVRANGGWFKTKRPFTGMFNGVAVTEHFETRAEAEAACTASG